MELKIIDKKKKPLLSREEITAEIFFDGKTPSKTEVKKLILNDVKANRDLVIIKKIRTYFGIRKATVTVYVYGSKEAKGKIEPKEKKKEGEKSEGEKKEETKEKEGPDTKVKKEEPEKEEKKEAKKEEKQEKKKSPQEEKKETKESKESKEEGSDKK